jgi:isocitrate lyase
MNQTEAARLLQQEWAENPRWKHVERDYSAADVVRLRGSVRIEHTLARIGAEKLWRRSIPRITSTASVRSRPVRHCSR